MPENDPVAVIGSVVSDWVTTGGTIASESVDQVFVGVDMVPDEVVHVSVVTTGCTTSPVEVPDQVMVVPEFVAPVSDVPPRLPLEVAPVDVAQEAVLVAQLEVTFELGTLVATVRTVSRVAIRSPAKNT